MIGKSLKPRCFAGVRSLPTNYAANKRAWMTSILFEKEMKAWDLKLQAEDRNVLVIIDNCPSHPKDLSRKLENINLHFLPPNLTSIIQPMDAGIIRNIKVFYRRELVRLQVQGLDDDTGEEKVTVLTAMDLLAQAWSSVREETIKKCFKEAKWIVPNEDEDQQMDDENENEEEISSLENDSEYLAIDDDVATSSILSDSDIVELLNHEHEETTDMDETLIESSLTSNSPSNSLPSAQHCLDQLKTALFSKKTSPKTFKLFYELEQSVKSDK